MSELHDVAAERALLGFVLEGGGEKAVAAAVETGLRPEHFFATENGDIFVAMLSLADHGSGIDSVTVVGALDRLGRRDVVPDYVRGLSGRALPGRDAVAYAGRLVSLARWRHAKACQVRMELAIANHDERAMSDAVADLDHGVRERRTESYSPEAWAEVVVDYLAGFEDGVPDWVVPMPWGRINDALGGGLWAGEVMVVSGATNAGKSIVLDQILDHAAARGFTAHCYMTEMTALTRGLRYVTRQTGLAFPRLRRRDIGKEEAVVAFEAMSNVKYGVTIAAGWDVDEIVADALRARYQLVVVDLLHGFHYEDERGLDRLSKAMQRLARVSTTIDGHPGCAVVAAAHLKDNAPKLPTSDSIKGAASIKQDADFIAFIASWPEGDDVEGKFYITKGRSGDRKTVDLRLNPKRFRFEVKAPEEDPVPPEETYEQDAIPF